LRVFTASVTPIIYDEAYYWTWSKHLAMSYYDHPPMVALLIRAGTTIGGDTPLGVRIASLVASIAMSWAVYRTAQMLLDSRRAAMTAVVLLNATLMVSIGTIVVTPDAPLMVASSFVLYCLAKVKTTDLGQWWVGVGFAAGIALLSKYSALFLGASIVLWLLLVPELRHWFKSAWLYVGGVVALALFMPVLIWNADRHWVSFIKQLGRTEINAGLTLKYTGEMIAGSLAFASPAVFVLGIAGMYAFVVRKTTIAPWARTLIHVTLWPMLLYFSWHELHQRVDPNWLSLIYPSFAIAAAFAVECHGWTRGKYIIEFWRRWALPSSLLLFILVVLQANTGLLTAFHRDALAGKIAVGFPELAREIDAVRRQVKATCIITGDYGDVAALTFYLPKKTCVAQWAERIRWEYMPEPTPEELREPLLYVVIDEADDGAGREEERVQQIFPNTERLKTVVRKRGPVTVQTYGLYLLAAPGDSVLDRSPPPELQPVQTR
jgi:Dolichyl-phosphate-mannose-protein mannosyltransferase